MFKKLLAALVAAVVALAVLSPTPEAWAGTLRVRELNYNPKFALGQWAVFEDNVIVARSGIHTDSPKPGWKWAAPTSERDISRGNIVWVYDEDHIVPASGLEENFSVYSDFVDDNHRATRTYLNSSDNSPFLCYREWRVGETWYRSHPYQQPYVFGTPHNGLFPRDGQLFHYSTHEDCRRAAWNAWYAARGEALSAMHMSPAEEGYPTFPPTAPQPAVIRPPAGTLLSSIHNISESSLIPGAFGFDSAQPFTTGSNPTGYTLTRVELHMLHVTGSAAPSFSVSIRTGSSDLVQNPSTTLVAVLRNPRSLPMDTFDRFDPPDPPPPVSVFRPDVFRADGLTLRPNATYYLVIDVDDDSATDSLYSGTGIFGTFQAATGWTPGPDDAWSFYRDHDSDAWQFNQYARLAFGLKGYANAPEAAQSNSGPPVFEASSVTGDQLKIKFDEPLDEDATPDGGRFTVQTTPNGGGGPNGGAGGNGGWGARAMAAAGNGPGRTIAGTGTVGVDGATVTVKLARPVPRGATVTVTYSRPGDNAIRDPDGNEAEDFSGKPAAYAPPAVTAVAVVSDPGDDDTYGLNDEIRVRVTFSEAVSVDTAGGTPRLKIKLDPAYGEQWANYQGGTGSNSLAFTYTVAEPNLSTQGIAVLRDTLELNGGDIESAATNTDADLSHGGLYHDPDHTVDWRLQPTPTSAPTSLTVAGASTSSLWVSWTKPGGHRAAGYELRYYAGAADPADASDWTATGDLGTATAATIDNLAADTGYRVQVRALGGDGGTGPWSATGPGRTKAPGDTTPPSAQSATVDGHEVTVTFDEVLATVGEGAGLRYMWTVTTDGVDQHPFRASAAGLTVTMRIGTAATAGQTVTLKYGGGGLIEDAEGNETAAFDLSVGEQVDPEPLKSEPLKSEPLKSEPLKVVSVPAFDDGAGVTLSIDENHADGATVGAVAATDIDGDTLTYSLTGDDAASFGIGAGGQISVKSGTVLDHETKASYAFTAQVTDGEDADGNAEDTPVIDDTIAVTVQVGDVAETPVTTGVAIASRPADGDTYANGETIRVRVTFSAAVDVSGTPRLKLKMDPGYGEKWASYASGSGTTMLQFTYTVVEPNLSPQGIAVLGDSLELNGGDIESASTDTDANLSHGGLAHDANHKVDWRPAVAPAATVTAVAVTSDAGDDATYGPGDTIRVTVTFSAAVDVSGAPRLKIKMDPGYGEFWAAYREGSGGTALTFTHTVAEPNSSPQGIAVLANTLELNGGAIASAATASAANLAHTGLGHDPNHKVDWQRSSSGGGGAPATPTVDAVAIVSDSGDDATYGPGDVIRIRVTFSAAVDVSGTPRLKLKMDPGYGEKWAAYEGGGGATALTFTHTVVEPNFSPQGVAVLADSLELNGGAIAASSVAANLSHPGLPHDPAHKVDWRP